MAQPADDFRPGSSTEVRRGPVGGAQLWEWWKLQRPNVVENEWNDNIYLRLTPPPGTTPADLMTAMMTLVARHEALRTTFGFTGRGTPEQIVHAPYRPALHEHRPGDEDATLKFVNSVRWHRFDISGEWPLCMGAVVEDGAVREVVVSFPHVVTDGGSWITIRTELDELLRAAAEDRPPRLPDVERQALDAAVWDSTPRGEAASDAALRYWSDELNAAPNRLFVAPHGGAFDLYQGNWVSPTAPAAFEAAAQLYHTSSAVVYSATIHLLLAVLSGVDNSLLRSHFSGRVPEFSRTVGCFHRILFTSISVADRPTLSDIVVRTAASTMRAQRRYRFDYLRYKEQESLAMRRRGVAFAWGSTVNYVEHQEEAVSAVPVEAELSVRRIEPVHDVVGMDAYLAVRMFSNRMEVEGGFSGNTLTVPQMELILRGPELVVARALRHPEVTFDELVELLEPPATANVACRLAGARICDVASTRELIASHPDVVAAHVQRDDGRLIAFVVSGAPALDPCELREFVLDRLTPDLSVVCPDQFVICLAARHGPQRWESLPLLAEGAGLPVRFAPPRTEREHALCTAVRECNELDEVDMARSYVEAGGHLLHAPAVLRRTGELGYAGIEVEDLARPRALARVAAQLGAPGR